VLGCDDGHGGCGMRRPLVGVSIALCVGAALGGGYVMPVAAVAGLAVVALGGGVLCSRRHQPRAGTAWVLLGTLALGILSGSAHRVHQGRVMAQMGVDLSLTGTVVSDVAGGRFLLRAPGVGVIPVRVSGRFKRWPQFGDRLSVTGTLERDWREKPVVVAAVSALSWHGAGPLRWMASVCRLRRGIALQLVAGVEGPPAAEAAVQAMVLGYRERIDRETRASFAATGTSHVFALSGLHVAYLCAVVYFLVTCLGVPRRWWWMVLLPFVVLYVVVTGGRASALRAGMMMVAMAAAPAVGRQPDAPSALAFSASMLALAAPGQLLELGAIYSFSVVTGIMVLYPVLKRITPVPSLADPLAREDMAPTRLKLDKLIEKLLDVVRVSLAAWLVSLPLTAHYFGRISLVAPLANLFVIPLTGLILTSAVLSLAVGLVAGGLAVTLNHATVGLASVLVSVSRWFAAIPCASVTVTPWPWGVVWVWLVLLAMAGVLGRRQDAPGAGSRAFDVTS
jgi:ComEC/Rec2-related protein